MAHSLVRQPNGLLAVFSSIIDNFIVTDATPEQIVEWCVAEAATEEREKAERWVRGNYRVPASTPWRTSCSVLKLFMDKRSTTWFWQH